jgi:hypothetical protein
MKQRNTKQAGDGDELAEIRRIDQNQGDVTTNQSNYSISFIIKIIQYMPLFHFSYIKVLSAYHTQKIRRPSPVDFRLRVTNL